MNSSDDKDGVALISAAHPNWAKYSPLREWLWEAVNWFRRRRCRWTEHSIVSVINGDVPKDGGVPIGPYRHMYDYCERCGQTWFRFGL